MEVNLQHFIVFVFLFIAAIGGGTWGVDKLRAKEK
jgi:hypothetical protein